MRSRAAIVREIGGDWSVEEFELDPPRAGEVLVRVAAAGLCHSDDHIRDGFMSPPGDRSRKRPPTIGGHEASGVVVEVGDGGSSLAPGDHVVAPMIATSTSSVSGSRGSGSPDHGSRANPAESPAISTYWPMPSGRSRTCRSRA